MPDHNQRPARPGNRSAALRLGSWLMALAVVGSTTQAQETVADAQSVTIVEAAQRFLDSLSTDQRGAVTFAFDDVRQRANWSNFPEGFFDRAGVSWDELDADQRQGLTRLLGAILSPRGMSMVVEQMAADDQLRDAAGSIYGSENYHVSFLGEPSTTSAWMLQFGGHHLAINATVVGPHVTLSPTLTGGQPVRFSADGVDIYIVEREVTAAGALLESLTEAQRRVAIRGDAAIGPLLGAGQDGESLPPQGLPGSELDAEQRQLLLALIEARLGILNDDDFAATMAPIRANLDDTYFAWFGSTSQIGTAYWRVAGPTVVLEFAPQSRDGDPANHLHNIYRDPTNDYGQSWWALN